MNKTIVVDEAQAGLRLDRFLAAHFPDRSRASLQELIEEGRVLVNGAGVKKRTPLAEGDQVAVELVERAPPELKAEAVELDILYEDEALLVVNKPAGLVVHPGAGNWTGTFAHGLLHHCGELGTGLRPGIVHRLDKETSGVLVAAKTEAAQQRLVEAFSSRRVKKVYLALCVGNPGNQTIRKPIGRHPRDRKKWAVVEGGKEAVTHCEPLASGQGITLVKLGLETGRTHQIRVHMRAVGCPVLGDPVYGDSGMNQKWSADRQMLHAYQIELDHPMSGERRVFRAPLPSDFSLLSTRLGVAFAPMDGVEWGRR
ncbi:MAG: RluA family pseudouridine synthase [Parachlamydiales bacterium]